MKQRLLFLSLVVMLLGVGVDGWGQTNPTAFDLSSDNFSFTTQTASNTAYPTNMKGWTTGTNNLVGITTDAPGADQALVANGTASTSGLSNLGANGFNFLSTGSSPNRQVGSICLAVNTTGRSDILVSWLADDQTSGSTRQMNITLQYRIGNTGSFTTIAETTYTTSNNSDKASQSFSNISLPTACENESVVQLRWITYESSSQTGGRDAIRLDDISVTSSPSSSHTITTGVVSTSPFCVTASSGAVGTVAYTSTGTFNGTFTAQLSDASGSFAGPENIGSGTSPISITIPTGTASGTGYKIRVVNTDPETTGSESAAFEIINGAKNVSAQAATTANQQSVVSWTNPSGCYDEIMVVGKAGSAVSITPTGDGSAYTANLAFGSGTGFDGGYVLYKESSSPQTITGLSNGTTYYFTFFSRFGSVWSSGVTTNAMPNIPNTTSSLYNGSSSAWLNVGNWPNGLPSSSIVAQFGTAANTTVGFNMNGATVEQRTVAGIELVSGASARIINNSSGTASNNLILSGAIINHYCPIKIG